MALSMYQASVPVFLQLLGSLSSVLKKAQAHAETRKLDPTALLSARLFPDMFTLTRQVQLATDHAKGGAARLAGVDIPSYPDTESSFEELQGRLSKTMEYLKSFKPEQIDGSEGRDIVLTIGGQKFPIKGQAYLLH